MPIVTALNQKGGVGKTSTCYHLAGTLAQSGRRVLLVDILYAANNGTSPNVWNL
jgi:cellulose biosynthesis protein BcsQ